MKTRLLLLVGAVAALPGSSADARKFDVQLFKPQPDQLSSTFLGTAGSTLDPGEFSMSTFFNYANDPLVLYGDDGKRLASLVGAQWGLDVLGAIGLHRSVTLGLDVPVILAQSGDTISFAPSAPNAGFGIGDIRLQPKVQLVGGRDESGPYGLSLAAVADLYIPSGNRKKFQGDRGFRMQAKMAGEYRIPGFALLLGNLGYVVRPEARAANVDVNDMLAWTLGGEVYVGEKWRAITDINGGLSVLAHHIDAAEVPMEWLVGARYFLAQNLALSGGFGAGLVRGVGTPDYRLFAGVNWVSARDIARDADGDGLLDRDDACPEAAEDKDGFEDKDGCPDPDNDADGLADIADKCPLEAEDKDAFRDDDGCPDPDNDGDSVLDAADKCPLDPEDKDGFEDDDGCPDTDNDADGVLDAQDGAPNDPEDKDGFQDEDGVPDPDNDEDGVQDAADKCPTKPETLNGFEDDDGCPDTGGKVLLTCEKIEIREKVYFDSGSSRILSRSFGLLNQVTSVLKQATQITKLRIEGHTDSRGDDNYNTTLSQGRADSVRDYLEAHGIDVARLESVGFGETMPIASNKTNRGRETNRRVEFVVVERTAGCAASTPAPVK